ncbi:PPR domain-containing protein/PPR_2 domain-containing protein [Cephalotus follicularis]|uniref:PPR domain-containing protein/PPR_2 domain-containing protein n=1 Tax=Cephalotus follicularis TaxID=3775 RepID=A0A1Q3BAZ5_CEPFO|nr:PPR domain-containing protein/PPR_2 domain-containing protein [Cephalotus follicularis]
MRNAKPLLNNVQNNTQIERALQNLNPNSNGLDCAAYGRILQHCTIRYLPLQARQLHARIVLFSVTPDNFLASKLISVYCKTNLFPQARHVFNQIPRRNVFSFNALLIGYSLQNMFTDTLRLFSSLVTDPSMGLRPDNFTVTCVLKAVSGVLCDCRLAKEVHGYVLRCGFDADMFVVNGLVKCYSTCDDIVMARRVFDKMPERDIVSWNSMIAGYSQGGFYEECKGFYREMVSCSRLRPDGVTVVSVLQACGQSTDLIFGMEVHRYVNESQIEMDLSLSNALIGLYAKCGSLDYARELFDEMSEKDEVTYCSIISGYMVHGFVEKAMALFHEMNQPDLSTWNAVISGLVQNNRHEGGLDLVREMIASGSRPNPVTLSSVLPSFSYFSNLKGGKEIHAYAIRKGYDRNIYVATAIIDVYSKSGFLCGAQKVFNQSRGRTLIIWTAIISAFAAHGDASAALSLFDEMLSNGIQPDPVTFTAVLAACAHSGEEIKAQKIFKSMFAEYGIEPSVEHYACMVGVLSRAGRLTAAADFISKMPIEPSAEVWGALLNGASVSGDVALGKFACDRLTEIEPESTGNYIIMANLYSQAGRWEEADRVREKMKKIGLKKVAGSSWVETSGGLQSFIAKGISSELTEEIYEMLEGLLGLMRQDGCSQDEEMAGSNWFDLNA